RGAPACRSVEQARQRAVVGRRAGWQQAEVFPRGRGGDPPTRGAHEQPLLDEERLVDVLDRLGRFADADGEGGEADRPAAETSAQRLEDGPGGLVETEVVDAEEREAVASDRAVDDAVAVHLGEVAHL